MASLLQSSHRRPSGFMCLGTRAALTSYAPSSMRSRFFLLRDSSATECSMNSGSVKQTSMFRAFFSRLVGHFVSAFIFDSNVIHERSFVPQAESSSVKARAEPEVKGQGQMKAAAQGSIAVQRNTRWYALQTAAGSRLHCNQRCSHRCSQLCTAVHLVFRWMRQKSGGVKEGQRAFSVGSSSGGRSPLNSVVFLMVFSVFERGRREG